MFLDESKTVLYVGKAKNLKKRVSSYYDKSLHIGEKTRYLISQTKTVKIIQVESEIESLLLEAHFIKKYTPKYNVRLTDGKSYPLIQITMNDEFPKVLIARRIEKGKSLYYGPYPSSEKLKLVLKTIRKIFPFQSVRNHPKRICLYNHLSLCPCPALYNSEENKRIYRKNILYIKNILSGKIKKVISLLEAKRNRYANEEQFEKAHVIQEKINALLHITKKVRRPFEYEMHPNLTSDIRSEELDELISILQHNGIFIHTLHRIECYDVSTMQGIGSTGSMVVFTNGEKDPSCYRRFRIKEEKGIGKPNDYAMIEEIVERRIHHAEWQYPDLIIVDGGKGQISTVGKVLVKNGLKIPLIGLAKRMETIITSDFITVNLPKSSNALKLLMRIRDEAHRFAITYHRKLRASLTFE